MFAQCLGSTVPNAPVAVTARPLLPTVTPVYCPVEVVQRRGGVVVWAGDLVFHRDVNGAVEFDSAKTKGSHWYGEVQR